MVPVGVHEGYSDGRIKMDLPNKSRTKMRRLANIIWDMFEKFLDEIDRAEEWSLALICVLLLLTAFVLIAFGLGWLYVHR